MLVQHGFRAVVPSKRYCKHTGIKGNLENNNSDCQCVTEFQI